MMWNLVRIEFKSGKVISQCQDGSISKKHSFADQSRDTLLFLLKVSLGWLMVAFGFIWMSGFANLI